MGRLYSPFLCKRPIKTYIDLREVFSSTFWYYEENFGFVDFILFLKMR